MEAAREERRSGKRDVVSFIAIAMGLSKITGGSVGIEVCVVGENGGKYLEMHVMRPQQVMTKALIGHSPTFRNHIVMLERTLSPVRCICEFCNNKLHN